VTHKKGDFKVMRDPYDNIIITAQQQNSKSAAQSPSTRTSSNQKAEWAGKK